MSIPVVQNNVYALPQACCVRQIDDPQYGSVTDHWVPFRTGDWGRDNTVGRVYARRFIAHVREENCTMMMVSILRTMVQKGVYDGVEAGFMQELAERIREAGG